MPLIPDPTRHDRILDEILVDCYNEQDVELMSWYYYMTDNLEFPVDVTVRFRGGATEIKPAQIVGIDPKSEQGSPIRLGITEPGNARVQYIGPEDLASAETTPENLEILNDWLYWHNFELL